MRACRCPYAPAEWNSSFLSVTKTFIIRPFCILEEQAQK